MKHLVKRIFVLTGIIFLATIRQTFAQNHAATQLLKEQQLKANIDIIGLNLSYERRVGNNLTAYFDGGLTYGFNYSKGIIPGLFTGNSSTFAYELAPVLTVSLRKYYNLQRRFEKNKSIGNNSGNYVNLRVGYRFKPIAYKNMYNGGAYGIEPSWGITRNLGEQFNFEAATGIAIIYDPYFKDWSSGLAINLRLGYIIF